MTIKKTALALAIACMLERGVNADTVTLLTSKDTQIESGAGANTNVGKYAYANTDLGGGGNRRTLMQWDLSTIPAGSTITNAYVKLYRVSATDDTVGKNFSAYRLTTEWTEGNGKSNGSYPAGITANGATWNQSNKETGTNWATAGGDYDLSSRVQISGVNQPDASLGGAIVALNFGVTDMVNSWFTGTTANLGMILVSDETVYQRHAFRMRDLGFPDDGAERPALPAYPASPTSQGGTFAPQLWVDYIAAVPEPSSMSLVAAVAALLGMPWLRRRR